jgi:hypothetical protein
MTVPDLSALDLAVADHHIDFEILFAQFSAQGHADAAGQTLPERAGRHVDARRFRHIGMSLKDAPDVAQGPQHRFRKISLVGERCILSRTVMPLGKHKAVAFLPFRIRRIDPHPVVIQIGDDVDRGQRSAGMAGTCVRDHPDDVAAELPGFLLQKLNIRLHFHKIIPLYGRYFRSGPQ